VKVLPLWLIAGLATLCAAALLVQGPRPRHPEGTRAWMRRLDADGDQRLSPEEFRHTARYPEDLELYDLDQDGHLSLWELEVLLLWTDPGWAEATPA
jgi:EF hand